MFSYLLPSRYWILIGPIVTLVLTYIAIRKLSGKLPVDGGRENTVDGAVAKGKPTSAGIIFISCMFIGIGLFHKITWKFALMYLCAFVAAICGYLDDRKPWGALTKGITDIFVAVGSATLASVLFPRTIYIFTLDLQFTIPVPLYILMAACLVWGSINVANATDGVDGLCGSLSIISTATFFLMTILCTRSLQQNNAMFSVMIYLVVVLGVYLWFNCHPSTLLMGDSGSQAIGVLLAFFALATANPFSYIIICLPQILDGGSSLLKLAVRRVTKKKFMESIRTPLHDHCRKNWNWSIGKVTERYVLLHVSLEVIYLIFLFLRLN